MLPLLPSIAWSQPAPSAAQAQALEQQIGAWLNAIVAPGLTLPATPVHLAPQGDHYTASVPIGSGANPPVWTANVKPTGNTWLVYDSRLPSPATFEVTLPASPGSDTTTPDKLVYTVAIGKQSGTANIDPTFSQPTHWSSELSNVDVTAVGTSTEQKTHVDASVSSLDLLPVAGGRVQVSSKSEIQGYRVAMTIPKAGAVGFSADHASLSSSVDNLSRDRAMAMMHALAQIFAAMPKGGATATPAQEADLKVAAMSLFGTLEGLATGYQIDEKLDGFTLNMAGMEGSLVSVRFGFSVKDENDLLRARLSIGAEGLTLPELGLGTLTSLIPTKVSFTPVVSKIPAVAVTALIDKIKADGEPGPDDMMAMFANGGIDAGLEQMQIDVAGASLTGQGTVTISSPTQFSGVAQFTATNLDALQQKLAANPQTAPGVAGIIFLKGIGKTVDNRMVWNVAFKDGHLLVNDQDMTAMMGGAMGGGSDGSSPAPGTMTPTPDDTPRSGEPQQENGAGHLRQP